jgi:hypothetical protein
MSFVLFSEISKILYEIVIHNPIILVEIQSIN